eukprot:gb/GECG01009496.1/.p1 GENE.gb/GECG01009496.1/~~gb/GECG01009496.1/.p1  ORF type:complete len:282 (+),score=45.86 gb/GECG01009496.1/:1-846(+)
MTDDFNPAAELRKSHMVLGFDHPDYTCTHHKDYKWPRQENQPQGGKNEYGEDLAALQRASHITLGDDKPDYESINHNSFRDFGSRGKPAPIEQDTRRVNFSLGHDPPQFETDYHTHFQWKEAKAESQEERQRKQNIMDELRATHFKLGDDKPDYSSTMQDQFEAAKSMNAQEREESRKKAAARAAKLKEVHYQLGYDQHTYTTTNFMPPPTNAERTKRVEKDTHSTNFSLGADNPEWVTQKMADEGIKSKKLQRVPDVPPRVPKHVYDKVMQGKGTKTRLY